MTKKMLYITGVAATLAALAIGQTKLELSQQSSARSADGAPRAGFDMNGFLAEGLGWIHGRDLHIGNPGDIGPSGITVHSGNTPAKPAFVHAVGPGGYHAWLYPCGSGRWCQDSVQPGNAATNPLITANSPDVLDNKTVGYWMDWSINTPTPEQIPTAGRLRFFATDDSLCWRNSAGVDKCVAALP